MFISFKFGNYLGLKDGKATRQYKITDSEFGIVSGVSDIMEIIPSSYVEIAFAVIQEYSKRNLNVAANLVLAFVWYNKIYPGWSIQNMIDYNKKHNSLFSQYEEDLQKYMVLL
jgi:hypothetical protein